MIAITSKYQKFLVVALAYIVSLGCIFLYVIPMAPRLLEQKKENDNLIAQKTQLNKKLSLLSQINQSSYNNYFNALEMALPSKKTVGGLLTQLETATFIQQATNSALVSLQTFSVSPGETASPAAVTKNETKIDVSLSLLGDKLAITRYIESIYKLPRFIKINSLNLNFSLDIYKADLLLSVYYQPLPATLGSVENSLEEINDQDLMVMNDYLGRNQRYFVPEQFATSSGKTNPFAP